MLQPIERRTCEAVGASRYYIIADLGGGGMARVELAVQSNLERVRRLAVIKRIHPHLAEQSEFVCMFIEEARIATALNHPNVVQTYEAGHDIDGCFLAMEFLRGQAYHRLIRTLGEDKVDPAIALEVLIATLQGLEYAHSLRDLRDRPMALVHRDISPQNVFLTYDGQVKILDFGIAKTLGSSVQTHTGMLKGKVPYMAPEQVKNRPLDARADLYAVGVMLWEAIAGRRRWGNMSEVGILQELISEPEPVAPGAAERGLPEFADQICLRALATHPRDRYRTAEEFRADLIQLAEQLGPRPTPAQLGEYLKYVFEEERREEQSLIETQLERLSPSELKGGVRMFMDDLSSSPRINTHSTTVLADKLQHTSDSSYGASVGDSAAMLEASLTKSPWRPLAMIGTGFALVLAVIFSIYNVVRSSDASVASGFRPVPSTAAPASEPAAPSTSAKPQTTAGDAQRNEATRQPLATATPALESGSATSEPKSTSEAVSRKGATSRRTSSTQKPNVRRSATPPKPDTKRSSADPGGIDRSDPWTE